MFQTLRNPETPSPMPRVPPAREVAESDFTRLLAEAEAEEESAANAYEELVQESKVRAGTEETTTKSFHRKNMKKHENFEFL